MEDFSLADLQRLMPRRYSIEREIAKGGMSRVYLAREDHPERRVAVKVMDSQLSDAGRQRFLQEVNFTSRLSHPHIVPIFAAGEVGDSLYYVMPFVEGETLADRIRREGSIPVEQAIQITLEVARALQYAHSKNVVHRDVKPDNIHFQDGQALVADFGIARVHSEADQRITAEGHTVGTVEYMAPEQATGAHRVDGRADQYSLACVLFEMLTGEPPFTGKTTRSTLAKHLSSPIPPVRALRDAVPEEVDLVVQKALRKNPQDRFADVGEFAEALRSAYLSGVSGARPSMFGVGGGDPAVASADPRRWMGFAVAAVAVGLVAVTLLWPQGEPSVAVLPPVAQVVQAGDNLDAQSLGDALASEITHTLSRLDWLSVRSFYSAKTLQDAQLSIPQIQDRLDVQHLIQVNLAIQGDQAVVTVAYVDGEDRLLEGLRYAFQAEDWIDEQAGIAEAVARDFARRLDPEQQFRLAEQDQPGAGHQEYLLGDRFLNQRTPREVRMAMDYFWQSIDRDPTYGPAYSKLSQAYALALTYRYDLGMNDYEVAGLSRALADRGIQENPNGAAGYVARSYIRALGASPADLAAGDIDRARQLDPNNPSVSSWSARVHILRNDLEAALDAVVEAVELDPMQSGRHIGVAYQAFHMGEHDMAVQYANSALQLEPDLILPRVIKARSLMLLGRADECLDMELGPHGGTRAVCLWAAGRQAEGQALADSLAEAFSDPPSGEFTRVIPAEDLAVFYAYTGRAPEALEWIRTAYALSPTGVEVRVLESDLFDPVRDSPGFAREVQSMRAGLWDRVNEAWAGPLERPRSLSASDD